MHPDIKENYRERLRLAFNDSIQSLSGKFEAMLALHAAEGRLGSGGTIKSTMDFIVEENAELYRVAIEHLKSLNPDYYPKLESDVLTLVKAVQESFSAEGEKYLQKGTERARRPDLYERMLPDVEAGMASELAKFQNSLNVAILNLKANRKMSPLLKTFWGVEALVILTSMFIAGMWYKDPDGVYEPILVGLGLTIPLVAVGIKLVSAKRT
jgi:hypothetical protein